jgi:hypothetical protein
MNAGEPSCPTSVKGSVKGVKPLLTRNDPLLGDWLLSRSEATLGRSSPAVAEVRRYGFPTNFALHEFEKWSIVSEGRGVRLQHFKDVASQTPASVSAFATLDGRLWADPYGPALVGQLVQYWRLDAQLVVRLVLDNATPPERLEVSLLAMSTSGDRLTVTSWDDATPQFRDVLPFNRQNGDRAPGDEVRAGRQTSEPAEFPPADDPINRLWVDDAGDPVELDLRNDPLHELWRIDPRLLVRRTAAAEGPSKWLVYAIPPAADTMTLVSWDARTPTEQDIRILRTR